MSSSVSILLENEYKTRICLYQFLLLIFFGSFTGSIKKSPTKNFTILFY